MDHVREVSFDLIYELGTTLSLDEMMIRFMGRSSQMHRIKGKLTGEGFKLFVLAVNNEFVMTFTPNGRTAAENTQARKQYN